MLLPPCFTVCLTYGDDMWNNYTPVDDFEGTECSRLFKTSIKRPFAQLQSGSGRQIYLYVFVFCSVFLYSQPGLRAVRSLRFSVCLPRGA